MSAWVKVSVADRATAVAIERAVDWRHIDRVDQLGIGIVHVVGVQHGCRDHIAGGAFGYRRSRVGRQHLLVVDRRDVDVDRPQILIRAAACAGVAQVVDDHVDRVGIVADRVGGPCKY